MLASQDGRTDVVELLIKHNADINARTNVRLHIRDNMRIIFIRANLTEPQCFANCILLYMYICLSVCPHAQLLFNDDDQYLCNECAFA